MLCTALRRAPGGCAAFSELSVHDCLLVALADQELSASTRSHSPLSPRLASSLCREADASLAVAVHREHSECRPDVAETSS